MTSFPTSGGPWMIFVLLFLEYVSSGVSSANWEHLSLRYGIWYRPPRTPREAKAMGYRRVNGICKMDTYHGFLYVHPNNDKSRLIFDSNDQLSGIQTAIPGNMMGFNENNDTVPVPTKEVIPPILLAHEHYSPGVRMYTITAYFKDPSLICGPYSPFAHPGKGLYIQRSYEVVKDFERIPLDARNLPSSWKPGTCLPSMGRHYFKYLTRDLPCENLYPVFLMYNAEGQLGAFGWLFQGVPPSESPRSPVKWFRYTKQLYPAIFDQSMLPACMMNPAFHIFGIRIYLRNELTMTCPGPQQSGHKNDEEGEGYPDGHQGHGGNVTYRPLHPRPGVTTSHNPQAPKYTNSETNNVIVDDVIRDGHNGGVSSCVAYTCVHLMSVCVVCSFMFVQLSSSLVWMSGRNR